MQILITGSKPKGVNKFMCKLQSFGYTYNRLTTSFTVVNEGSNSIEQRDSVVKILIQQMKHVTFSFGLSITSTTPCHPHKLTKKSGEDEQERDGEKKQNNGIAYLYEKTVLFLFY